MGARFRSWWQKVKRPLLVIGVVAASAIAIILIVVEITFYGTGFNGYTIITTSKTTSGAVSPPITTTTVYQPGKTLWDWLQLLFIPVVLAVAGFWFNHRERKAAELRVENERKAAELRTEAERKIEEQRTKTERDIAEDNQREAALQSYINEMSELLLEKKLRESTVTDEVRIIARVRTLTVLPRLDGKRKRNLLLFLLDAGLIDRKSQIIDVSDADLSKADLSESRLWRDKWIIDSLNNSKSITTANADLSGVNLRNANLNGADLSDIKLGVEIELEYHMLASTGAIIADLSEAKLIKANLSRAVLIGVNLHGADLSEANLDGAKLQYANLSEANMHGADLSIDTFIQSSDEPEDIITWIGANLRGANLSRANLSETNLVQANLSEANLSEADLCRANLGGANLKDVRGITVEELKKQAKSIKGAIMPDGKIHP